MPPDTCNIPALVIKQSEFSVSEKLLIIKTGKRHNIDLEFRIIDDIRQQNAASVLAVWCDYPKPNCAIAANPCSGVSISELLLILLHINKPGVIIADMDCGS